MSSVPKGVIIDEMRTIADQAVITKLQLLDEMERYDNLVMAFRTTADYDRFTPQTVRALLNTQKLKDRASAKVLQLGRHEEQLSRWVCGFAEYAQADGLAVLSVGYSGLIAMSRPYLKEGLALMKGHITLMSCLLDMYRMLSLEVSLLLATAADSTEENL